MRRSSGLSVKDRSAGCRTELQFGDDRGLKKVRQMIVARPVGVKSRKRAGGSRICRKPTGANPTSGLNPVPFRQSSQVRRWKKWGQEFGSGEAKKQLARCSWIGYILSAVAGLDGFQGVHPRSIHSRIAARSSRIRIGNLLQSQNEGKRNGHPFRTAKYNLTPESIISLSAKGMRADLAIPGPSASFAATHIIDSAGPILTS